MNIKWLEGDEFSIPVTGKRCRVIGVIPDQIVTQFFKSEPSVRDGHVISDPERDLVRLYVLERHRASVVGKGLMTGFGLKRGAIASSIGHDSHNIIAAGISDRDIMKAVTTINKMGCGIAVVDNSTVLEALELPIAGLMSNKPIEFVSSRTRDLIAACRSLGIPLEDPLMTLSFMALPVIPRLKLTDRGLVDVEKFAHVDLFLSHK